MSLLASRRKLARRHRLQRPLRCELLEGRAMMAANFAQFLDPNPAPDNKFGHSVVPLSTGHVVVTSPFDDAGGTDAGAVYLFNGSTGALISTLRGSTAGDNVGLQGVKAVGNGNFVVISTSWDNNSATDVGAVTFGNGVTGLNGVVSEANSLVGSTTNDLVGGGDVYVLTNGNYVVASPRWDNGENQKVGAFTFGSGTSGIKGTISAGNSLVGDSSGDGNANFADIDFVIPLTNGNYVVNTPAWNGNGNLCGAVTFGNGTTGISGVINGGISLVGSQMNDSVGGAGDRVVALPNGNYVVTSGYRNPDGENGDGATSAGAVTLCDGVSGTVGEISEENSLIGTSHHDRIGASGIIVLANSNYVVVSPFWDNGEVTDTGAVTFGNGTTGAKGIVSAANSLVGSTANDKLGARNFYEGEPQVVPLTNGNYAVISIQWDRGATVDAGAVTFGDGQTGISGLVSENNSLVGTKQSDAVGANGVTALTNGNYVVSSSIWDNGANVDAGAATFGDGDTGVTGEITLANSLIGNANDRVASKGVTALTNGNYVVASPAWRNGNIADAGAATWGNGATGVQGLVSVQNSFVGSSSHKVGIGGVTALTNGNYVVIGYSSATFGLGATGLTGLLSVQNSLYGGDFTANFVGSGGVVPLANGNYVVISPSFDYAFPNVGAVTFGSGQTGISGSVTPENSLLGSTTDDWVGREGVTALPNGNYVVRSAIFDNGALEDAGAATFGNGTTGVVGTIDNANSRVGAAAEADLQPVVVDSTNGTYFARFLGEGNGKIRVGSQTSGFDKLPVVASFGGNLSFTENASPLRISPTATVTDADSLNFAGGRLTIRLTSGGGSSDRLAIRTVGTASGQINVQGNEVFIGTIRFGSFTGGVGTTPLVVTLDSNANAFRVQSLLRNITFQNLSDNPSTAVRTVQATLSDGDGGVSAAVSKSIAVAAVNDKPVLTLSGSLGYKRNDPAVVLAPNATVTDADNANFGGGTLRVWISAGGGLNNTLAIGSGFTVDAGNNVKLGSTIIGKRLSNGVGTNELRIQFNLNATQSIVQQLVRSITYRNVGGSTGTRTIAFTVSDGDGGLSDERTKTVNVT